MPKKREIKFRAWLRKDKEMVLLGKFEDLIWDCNGYTEKTINQMELMQYTGLKDKNGKEIYEGDIVKGISYKEPIVCRTSIKVIGVVEWTNNFGNAGFDFHNSLPKGFRTYPNLQNCEVIGNIYENPELLNK